MYLSHLTYFCTLVRVGNYTEAAKKLYISQSTLSIAMINLEKEIDVTLFQKKRPRIELTKDGQEFYEAVQVATKVLDDSLMVIRERKGEKNKVIRVGTVFSIQHEYWSRCIMEFRNKLSSGVELRWAQGFTADLMEELKKGNLDLIFASVLDKDPEVCSFPCWSHDIALVVHKDHPLASRSKISLREVTSWEVLTYRIDQGPFVTNIRALLREFPELRVTPRFNDEITLCSLITADKSTVGIVNYSWLVDSFHEVVALEIEEYPRGTGFHQFYVSYLKNKQHSRSVKQLIKFLEEYTYIKGRTLP